MIGNTILWRRVDAPGHDACRLLQGDAGWRLEGTAVFLHEGVPTHLAYAVECDHEWRTRGGGVAGWVGGDVVDARVLRTSEGTWTLNGSLVSSLDGCVDLDLGFTPATNLFQVRRVALRVGQAAAVPVAWLDVPACTLETLHQRYERRTVEGYWYEAPRFDYSALLQVNALGFVEKYPKLWEMEVSP